ncbi:hypothetical protein C8J55DRAFT_560948 [Lentinula edodes]|uniref:Uncharacterized protein n=1 Tax=Lentinula lateritia TaxID=40482 RepID=A0A9W9DQC9_9AGAR|nr:hypothetical protein C8J55DRAFT_560948 [Lentinula edodes]
MHDLQETSLSAPRRLPFAGLDLAHARLFFQKHCDEEQEKSYGITHDHWAKLHTSLCSSTSDQDQALRLRLSRPRPEKRMLSPSDVPPKQSKKTKLSVPEKRMLSPSDVPPKQSKKTKLSVPETPVEDPQPAPPVPTTCPSKFKPSIPRSFNPPPPISTPQSQFSSEHSTTLDPQSLPQLKTNGSTSSSNSIQRQPNVSPDPSSSERELAKLTSLLKDTAALLAIRTEEVQRLQREVKVQALGNTHSQEYVTLQNLLPGPPSITLRLKVQRMQTELEQLRATRERTEKDLAEMKDLHHNLQMNSIPLEEHKRTLSALSSAQLRCLQETRRIQEQYRQSTSS